MILRRRPNGQAPASSPARAARCWAATAWARTRFARTLSLLNKLWDGAPHIVDRATAASFAVRGARLTISLQVQPHVLADFLDRDRGMAKGSGFLARFLVAQPASLQGSRRYKEPAAMPDLGAFNARIGEMLEDLPTIDGERGLMLPLLELDPIAKAHWVTVYDSIEGQLSGGGRLRGHPGRCLEGGRQRRPSGMCPALLRVRGEGADRPTGGAERGPNRPVAHLQRPCAAGALHPVREAANAATLDRWLIDRCQMEGVEGFPTRVVLRGGPNGTRKREDFDKALEILCLHGRARVESIGRRRTIKVNPALLDGSAQDDDDAEAPELPARTARAGWRG